MSTIPSAYPLQWPHTFPRTTTREKGAFKTTLPNALGNVQRSLKLFSEDSRRKLENLVISSNVTLGVQPPMDPGVSVWFIWDGISVCIAVDRYQTVEANLQAIHHIIEARRTELRHGTLALVRATFQGFKALPEHAAGRTCWQILGIPAGSTPDQIQQAYRKLALERHPDRGGSNAAMSELNDAYNHAFSTCRP